MALFEITACFKYTDIDNRNDAILEMTCDDIARGELHIITPKTSITNPRNPTTMYLLLIKDVRFIAG